MGVNTEAFKRKGFRNSNGEKKGGEGGGSYIRYIDLKKLEADTGITKLKMEADGKYHLDFLPFPITRQHPYYKEIKEEFAAVGDDNPMDYLITIFVHEVKTDKYTQKFICPKATYGKDCPFCDEYWRIYNVNRDAGMDTKRAYRASKEELQPLKHKGRNISFVYNRNDGKVYYFEYSDFFFGEKLNKKLSRSTGDDPIFVLPDVSRNGRTVHFFVEPSALTDSKGNPLPGKIEEMEFLKRDSAVPDEAYEDLPALDSYLQVYDSATIESFLDGTYFLPSDDNQDDDDEDEDESPAPAPQAPRRAARTQQPVEDDDSDLENNNPLDGNYDSNANSSAYSVEEEDDDSRSLSREERRERRRKRQQAQQEDPVCPAGGKFGEDTDTFDACDDCPIYDDCDRRYEETH